MVRSLSLINISLALEVGLGPHGHLLLNLDGRLVLDDLLLLLLDAILLDDHIDVGLQLLELLSHDSGVHLHLVDLLAGEDGLGRHLSLARCGLPATGRVIVTSRHVSHTGVAAHGLEVVLRPDLTELVHKVLDHGKIGAVYPLGHRCGVLIHETDDDHAILIGLIVDGLGQGEELLLHLLHDLGAVATATAGVGTLLLLSSRSTYLPLLLLLLLSVVHFLALHKSN